MVKARKKLKAEGIRVKGAGKDKSEPQNIEQEISNDEVWNRFTRPYF